MEYLNTVNDWSLVWLKVCKFGELCYCAKLHSIKFSQECRRTLKCGEPQRLNNIKLYDKNLIAMESYKIWGPIAPSSYANGTSNYKQWYCRHWTACQLVGLCDQNCHKLQSQISKNLFATCPRPPSFRIVLHTMSLTHGQMIIRVRPRSGPDVTWFAEIEACDDIYVLGTTIWFCAVLEVQIYLKVYYSCSENFEGLSLWYYCNSEWKWGF